MISTRDLALLAGVSQSTVSRSLRNHPSISRETKERIAAIAREHGYRIADKARQKKLRNKQKTIAVLMTGMHYTNLYLQSVFAHVFNEIENSRYLALLINDKEEIVDYKRIQDLVASGIIAGFIITNLHYNIHVHDYLLSKRMPHVYLHYFGKNSLEALDIVDTDNYIGGHIAAQHLLSLGHRRIKVLTASSASAILDNHTFDDRTAGFASALRSAQVRLEESDIESIADHNYESAYAYVAASMENIRKYDAVFAQTDTMAMGCINALHDGGVSVPDDVSVIGYDGIKEGIFSRPAVTTVRQSVEELAKEAVGRLLSLIDNPVQIPRRIFVHPIFLQRGSTRRKENFRAPTTYTGVT